MFEAGGNTDDGFIGLEQLIDLVDRFLQHHIDGLRTTLLVALLGNTKHLALRLVQQIGGTAAFRVKRCIGNFVGNADHLPQYGALPYDFGVGFDVAGTGGVLGKLRQIGHTTAIFQYSGIIQCLTKGHHIVGLG